MTLDEAINIIQDRKDDEPNGPSPRQLTFDYDLLDASLFILQEYNRLADKHLSLVTTITQQVIGE